MGARVWTLTAQPTVETVAEGLAVIGSRDLPRWTRVLGAAHNAAFTLIYVGGAAALMLLALDRLGPVAPGVAFALVLAVGLGGYLCLRWTRRAMWRAVARRSPRPDPDRWTLPAQGLMIENAARSVSYRWAAVDAVLPGPKAISFLAGGVVLTLPRAGLAEEAALPADIARWRG